MSPSKTSDEAVACYAPGKGIDHKSVNDSGYARSTLMAELGDITRFANPRRFMAYLGLVPSEHSRKHTPPGRDHQGGQWRGAASADRGGMELPVPGADPSRSPSASGKVEQAGPPHGVESPRTGFRLFGDRPNKAGEVARNRGGDHGLQLPRMPELAIPTA
jgi:hypothetical protein